MTTHHQQHWLSLIRVSLLLGGDAATWDRVNSASAISSSTGETVKSTLCLSSFSHDHLLNLSWSLMNSLSWCLPHVSNGAFRAMMSTSLATASHSKRGQPFISAQHSTDPHDRCLVQLFRKLLQIMFIRQYHELVAVVEPLISLLAWLHKHGLNFPISNFISVNVSMTTKLPAASRVPYMPLSNRPHQPAFSLSGSPQNSRCLDGDGHALCSEVNEHEFV